MPHYRYFFWKPAPHLCKESGVPTMPGVLSLPYINHSISFINAYFLKSAILQEKLQQFIS